MHFKQIFTPFHVHDDTVLHFQLPLSCTPLICMVFILVFFSKSSSPLFQPIYCMYFCQYFASATRAIPLKWYHFKGLIALVLLLLLLLSLLPSLRSQLWELLAKARWCLQCLCQQLWLSSRGFVKERQVGSSRFSTFIIWSKMSVNRLAFVPFFSSQNGLILYCNSERKIPDNSQMFGGSCIIEELLTHFKWLH